jgi:DNA-binding response OmpR family regulator/anti-sigma regulatory factor (Ser/Thr protein kinase)
MKKELASNTKELFFNNVAHEFRTPLSLILGPADQLLGEIENPLHQQKLILIKRNALYLKQLIDQLLTLGKMETGNDNLSFQKVSLSSFFGELLYPFSDLAEMHGLVFKKTVSLDEEIYLGDIVKWKIVLNNLISNAVKFTPEGGEVEVKVFVFENMLKVRVYDTGIGISPQKIPHVFDRYYQEQKHINHYLGTGIGLALCKEVTEQLDGKLYVESVVGEGSTFLWDIPLFRKEKDVLKVFSKANFMDGEEYLSKAAGIADDSLIVKTYEIDENTEDPVVLIAEDHLELRQILKDALPNYKIIEASNGQEAIELAIKYIPRIVITDLMMPDVDGFELMELLKSDFRTSHIPIIVTSALSEVQHRIDALDKGASAFMPKPFNLKEVKLQIANLLALQEINPSEEKHKLIYKNDLSKKDQEFIERLNATIKKKMTKEHFGVEDLSNTLNISRVQLHRKVTALCGCSSSNYIKRFKLASAAEWLKQDSLTISEVAFKLGYTSLSHFSRNFKEEYSISPKEFRASA